MAWREGRATYKPQETIMEPQQEWQATLPAIQLEIEVLEERIAPSVAPGLLGYEGQPGNQGGGGAPGLRGFEGQPGNQGG
jgi:hypothetical protein